MRNFSLFVLLFVFGCRSAEAKPRDRQTVYLAIVGEAFSWCDASEAWALAHSELSRVFRGRVSFDLEYDQAHALSGPELTLENFWNYSIIEYWMQQAPHTRGLRWVALPPLNGRLYGGMSRGRFFFSNVEPGAPNRNAFVFLHELAHSFTCADSCVGERPSIMCADDYGLYRDGLAPLRYGVICTRRMRNRFGLRVKGKTLCIGRRCNVERKVSALRPPQ